MAMKYNVLGLLKNAAMQIKHRDGGTAYALLELGNNLRQVMRGEATIDDFKGAYTGHDGEPIDIDRLMPTPTDS
jgi:hypothetical protein